MPRVRNRYQCQRRECGRAFWSREPDSLYCSRSCSAKQRIETHGLLGLRPGHHPPPEPEPPVVITEPEEPDDVVEAKLARARAARRQWEWRHGRRAFTIEPDSVYVRQDGLAVTQRGAWAQKAPELNTEAW